MNDYRRLNYDRRFEPSTASMGKFFSNRLRDSMIIGGPLSSSNLTENHVDRTTADEEATPEPPFNHYDLQRSIVTPSSTSSNNDSYFTHTARDIHKFSRRVELSSGYNILKTRTNTRPARLPAFPQGRVPLAQLNPLPSAVNTASNPSDDRQQRRMSYSDHHRGSNSSYAQQLNIDGTRRPFSSDSPLPPSMPTAATSNLSSYYVSSAPPLHNRTAYDLIEPIKLTSDQEDSSIADLSRELRAAAYPTTRKSSQHSPTRETSPTTSRYTGRMTSKRLPPRSLPKLHGNESTTAPNTVKAASASHHLHHHHHHHQEFERKLSAPEGRLPQPSSNAATLLDQFFSTEPMVIKDTVPVKNDINPIVLEKSARDYQSSPLLLLGPPSPMRTPSIPNGSDDLSMSFVSKYARLAPIISSQPTNMHSTMTNDIAEASNLHLNNLTNTEQQNQHEHTTDTLHELSEIDSDHHNAFDTSLLIASDFGQGKYTNGFQEDDFSYVPLKEDIKSTQGVPLLELDELETSSDISESQLVPIIYAKELANEIDLLQKAHLLKQQQRSIAQSNDEDRVEGTSSVPPPANMELLNFEALDDEFIGGQGRGDTTPTLPSPTYTATMMETSSPAPALALTPLPPLEKTNQSLLSNTEEIETPVTNLIQQSILAHNRLSPWFRLPTELWLKILVSLSTDDLHSFSYVCKRFYSLAQDHACQHRIILNRRMYIKSVWLEAIQRRKPVSLSFIECRQQDLEAGEPSNNNTDTMINWQEFFQSLGPNLTEFVMSGCYHEPFTPNTLLPVVVQTCSNLTSLQLRWNNVTEATLNHLISYQQLLHLQTLDLSGCQILDDTMLINMFIRSEKDFHIRKLILHACTNITWMSLDTIAICLPNLVHLGLSRCIGLKNLSSNQSPSCFSYWPQLEYIDFGHLLTLTNEDLTIALNHCLHLKSLLLDHCIQLTDPIIDKLPVSLQMISINNCTNLTTARLSSLNLKCPNLQSINVSLIRNFNDECLIQWSAQPLKQLKTLFIDYCTDCTLAGVEKILQNHDHMQELSLNGNIISSTIDQKALQEKFSKVKLVFQ